jgi:hypothetical protein
MRNFGVFMIVATIAFGACREKTPNGVLDKEQMTQFLIEIYLAEARLGNMALEPDSAWRVFGAYEKALLQRKGLPDSVVKKSYSYYLEHPEDMQEILDAVMDSLSRREQVAGSAPQLR